MLMEKQKKTHNLLLFFKYFKKYKLLCFFYILFLLLISVTSFLQPLFLGKMIACMTVEYDYTFAIQYAINVAVLEFIGYVLTCLSVPFFKGLENGVKLDVKIAVLNKTLDINLNECNKVGNGAYINRLSGDLDRLSTAFKTISTVIIDSITKLSYLLFIFVVNVWLGVFVLVSIIIRLVVYKVRLHYLMKMRPPISRQEENINSVIGETIRGIKDVKVLGLHGKILSKIGQMQDKVIKDDNKEYYVGSTLLLASQEVSTIFCFFFICLCIYLIGINYLAVAIFYTLYLYFNKTIEFAVEFSDLQTKLKEMELCATRIFELVDDKTYIFDTFGDKSLKNFKGNIKFDKVNFAYEGKSKLFNDLSFDISANTHVAFVGESGCGKSTIANLICRLFKPDSGIIYLDKVDLQKVNNRLSDHVTMINQNSYMFNLTIRENMQLVKSNVTDDEIYEALKQANAYDFVKSLENGLDSCLGESGTKLSGGQKQRLCIARALIKNSKVIIFDEATSALDNLSQEKVMKSIEKLKKDHTIITIAHRLTTIQACDVIHFIKNEKIIASGTHEELIENCSAYKKLYIKQQKHKKRGDNE